MVQHRQKSRSYKYNAFISYHAADNKLAPAIQSALHGFARPWYRMRALRVFRDKTNLPANPGLWDAIERALERSEWFLLMASPRAACRPWVQREISWWLEHRSISHMLILLTEGAIVWDEEHRDFNWEQTTALPRILRGKFRGEPLYVDLRRLRKAEQLTLRHSEFRSAVVDIAAPLHGRDKDELEGEDVRQWRRFLRVRRAVATGLSLLTITAAMLATLFYLQRLTAIRNQINALIESSENALAANNQLEALLGAVKAGRELKDTSGKLSDLVRSIVDPQGWEETGARVTAGLHRVLDDVRERNRLEGHSGRVNSVAYSPTCPGTKPLIASASDDRMVRLWKMDGSVIETPQRLEHGARVTSVAFSPDCRTLASASLDQTIKLWSYDGTPIAQRSADSEVMSLDFSPDGQFLAWGGDLGQVTIMSLADNTTRRLKAHGAGSVRVRFSATCRDGKSLLATVSGSQIDKAPVKLWRLDGELFQALGDPGHTANALSFSSDCTTMAVADGVGTLALWRLDGVRYSPYEFLAHDGNPVNSIAFSPDGQTIATASESNLSSPGVRGNVVKLWNREGGKPKIFEGHKRPVTSVSFSPDGKTIVSGSADNTVRLWGVNKIPVVEVLPGKQDAFNASFSADGRRLALVRTDNTVELRDVELRNLESGWIRSWKTETDPSREVLFLLRGETFPVNVRALQALDENQGVYLKRIEAGIASLTASADGKLLAWVGGDDTVRIWAGGGKPVATVRGYSVSVRTLRFSPNGQALAFLASSHEQGTLTLWRRDKPAPLVLKGHEQPINAIAFSPNSQTLASGGEDHLVKLWDLDGRAIRTLSGSDRITEVVFHPQGHILATASYDDRVKIWSINGRELRALTPESRPILAIGFVGGGRQLVAVSQDGSVTRWNLDLKGLLHHGCEWLSAYLHSGRNLQEDDRTVCGLS
ncbi:MAG: TIR domain-containing protein [Gammaproteobacteria bacterium]